MIGDKIYLRFNELCSDDETVFAKLLLSLINHNFIAQCKFYFLFVKET